MRPSDKKRVLVTGGLGYLGSHVVAALLAAGHSVAVLGPGSPHGKVVHARLRAVTGQPVPWFTGDVRNTVLLSHAFKFFKPEAVLHFAGLKPGAHVGAQPVDFALSHVGSLLALLEAMTRFDVRTLLFSSSAAVYSPDQAGLVGENAVLGPQTPYGQAKLMCEQILAQQALSPGWKVANLRCFNPAGAHSSGLLGELYRTPNGGLFKQLARVLAGLQPSVPVFGDSWPTPDGTQVRDYFHVEDLADGFVRALAHLDSCVDFLTLNLGSGQGYSVREVVTAFEAAAGQPISVTVHAARAGDIHTSIAHAAAARDALGWQPERSLALMCEDTVRYVRHQQQERTHDEQ